jgi:hypothetical protein
VEKCYNIVGKFQVEQIREKTKTGNKNRKQNQEAKPGNKTRKQNQETKTTHPKMIVVPLSVTINASLSTTFPSYAISIYVPHSIFGITGDTFRGPSKRSSAT